jgi:hypothetical protein
MKIIACPAGRDGPVDHEIADATIGHFQKENGDMVRFMLPSKPITLSHGVEYRLFVTMEPKEIDELYRASMTLPKAVPLKRRPI